jgi:hypothetical protein
LTSADEMKNLTTIAVFFLVVTLNASAQVSDRDLQPTLAYLAERLTTQTVLP